MKTKNTVLKKREANKNDETLELDQKKSAKGGLSQCADDSAQASVQRQPEGLCATQMDGADTDSDKEKSLDVSGAEANEHCDNPIELGQRGEHAASKYLERRGFEILEHNWRCRYGEVDIIALDDDTIVFIEVKTRRGIDKGIPEEAITPQKRDRYEKIAASYLEQKEFVDCYVRFDVIAILAVSNNRALLRHHRGAFAHGD